VSGDAYQFTVSVDDSSSSNESSAENSANDSSSADTQGDTEGTTSEGDTPNFNVSTKEVPAVDITDDMINKAVEYISSNDEFADKVSGYKDAVVQKRDKAVAEKQAQEALNKKIESAKSAYDEVIAEYKKAQSDFKTSSTSDFMANKYKYVNSVFMYDDFGPECSYAYEDLDKDSIPELIVCSTDGGLVYGVFDYNPDNDTISSTNECAKYRYQFYYCGNGCFRTDASGGSECSDLKAYSYADGAVLNLVYELYYDGTDSSGKTYKVELYENGSTTNKTLSSQEMQNAISAMNAAYPVCKVNGTAIS
jgi:hypothetical protein